MTHEASANEAVAAAQQQPCSEHLDGAASGAAEAADVANDTSSDKDCCAKGECHCVHTSAAVAPTLTVQLATIDQARMPAFAGGAIQDRLSVLLRPPA